MNKVIDWALIENNNDLIILIDTDSDEDDKDIISSSLSLDKERSDFLLLKLEHIDGSKSKFNLKSNDSEIAMISKKKTIPVIESSYKYYIVYVYIN